MLIGLQQIALKTVTEVTWQNYESQFWVNKCELLKDFLKQYDAIYIFICSNIDVLNGIKKFHKKTRENIILTPHTFCYQVEDET